MEKKYEALINSERINLSEDEAEKAAQFHRGRCAFAWVNGKLVFNIDENDPRDHEHWLKEDFGITDKQFENLNRGYMVKDYIQLYKGDQFMVVDTSTISVTDFRDLVKKHGELFDSTEVEVRNGVKVGKVGDVWPPVTVIGTFNTI